MIRKYFFICISILACVSACKRAVKPGKLADGTLPFYSTRDFTPQWIANNTKKYDSVHTISGFSFVNQYGDIISSNNFSGKIYVAAFTMNNYLSLVQEAFAKDTTVLLVSFNWMPVTSVVTAGMIRNKWHLLTGAKDQVYRLAHDDYFAGDTIGENILLIDKHQRIRGVYKSALIKETNDLIADIKTLQTEK